MKTIALLCRMLLRDSIRKTLSVLFIPLCFITEMKTLHLRTQVFVSFLILYSIQLLWSIVYTFVKELFPYIKDKYLQISKLIYFRDGCAGQYKNCYNFINLLHHEADFGLQAEWNFFATSRGKNACDGIGGALKRSAAKASLQRPLVNQILNPLDFYNFCKTNVKNVKMCFVIADEVKAVTAFLATRFASANTIQETQKHHRFIPINENCLQIYQISSSNSEINSKIVKMMQDKSSESHKCEEVITVPTVNDLVDGYVCVVDSGKMWVAHVDVYDEEFDDYFVCFLHPSGVQRSYWFPDDEREQCFKSSEQILGTLPQPKLLGGSRLR